MILDEAIIHSREVAAELKKKAINCQEDSCSECAIECIKCSEEHEQLAEWLEELKALRETTQGRADAIDEYNKLIHKLDEDFTKENPKDGSTLYFWLGRIDKIAELLKNSK